MWIFLIFILSIIAIGIAYWKDFQSDKKEFKLSIKIVLKNVLIIIASIILINVIKMILKKI